MSNANRDYAIVYDIKNGSLVLSRPLNFYITDKNTSNIFVKLVTRIIVGNGIDQYVDIENASNYVLTMRVVKPNNEVKSIKATQHEAESIFQFDLTEDFKDVPGKCICELIISTIVSGRQELTTSDPFSYEVKRSVLSNVGEIIETEDTTVEDILNRLDVVNLRIDNLIKLEGGSTTGDAELIDARIGADGVVYSNLGTSIRTQLNNINNDIENIIGYNVKYNYNYTEGGYIDDTNGDIVTYDNWKYTDYILIDDNIKSLNVFTTLKGSYGYNAFYDANKSLISNFRVDAPTVKIPTGAKYFRVSVTSNAHTKITNSFESLKEISNNLIKNYIGASIDYSINWIQGVYISDTDGSIVDYETWRYTDYIEIPQKVEQLEITTDMTGSYRYNAFYDKNKNFIKVLNISESMVEVPSNAKYFRLSLAPGYSVSIKNKIDKLMEKCTLEEVKQFIENEGISGGNIDNTNIVYLNKDVEPFVVQASEGLGRRFADTTKPLVFSHFSDVHTRQPLWNRIVEYNNHYKDYIKFSIHTGDYCGGTRLAYIDLYANGTSCDIPLLNCVGNHDTYLADNSKGDKATTHNLLFNHTDNWGVTFMNIANSMTYYKDFASNKVRLIVLDYYYDIDAQCTWLLERLNEAKTLGYHVVTCMHEMSNVITNKLDTTFETIDDFESLGGNKYSKSKFDKVIGDWIKAGGVHVANFAGHEHSDFIGYTDNGVLNVCVQAATDDTIWTDGKRVQGTRTWDCFNVVAVEVATGTLKLIRIGNNADHYLREKKVFVYDYINKTIICN